MKCVDLQTINLPEGVTEIGDYAFYHCTDMTTVTIPDSVKRIGVAAFVQSGLTSAVFEEDYQWTRKKYSCLTQAGYATYYETYISSDSVSKLTVSLLTSWAYHTSTSSSTSYYSYEFVRIEET